MKFERRAIWPVLALMLTLPACQAERKPDSQRVAGGEVLPGSVSDAMLPLDTLRSQPPLAPRPTGSATASGGKAEAEAGASEAAEAAPAEAAAAEPAAPQ